MLACWRCRVAEGPQSVADYDYILPARTLHGSATKMLAEIDELVEGLLALRQVIAIRAKPVSGAPHRRHSGSSAKR